MEKRKLGKTGLPVTVLGYGAMELRSLDEQGAAHLLNTVLDSGINYIDTSPDYGPSEDYIGQGLAKRRDEYYLATKCGCNVDEKGKGMDPAHIWSPEQMRKSIENSLRRLKTDHVDVWQLHGPAPDELPGGAQDEVIQTMQEIKKQGKARFIGISFKNGRKGEPMYPAGYGQKYLQTFLDWNVFDVMQVVYGGLTRLNEDLITRAANQGVGMIIRGVVKKYEDNYPDLYQQAGLPELAPEGEDMNDFLIRYAISHNGISTVIIGTKSEDHLRDNVQAAEKGKLSQDVYEKAKQGLDAAGVKVGA